MKLLVKLSFIIFLIFQGVSANESLIEVVSSAFGLLHGFGFASALMEIGLPQKERITALLFFNVGVEIGQLIFVVCLLSLGWLIHKAWKKSADIAGSKIVGYVIGSVSMMWLFQRVLSF